MSQENYRRIRKGYEAEEPTTVGGQLFTFFCVSSLRIKDFGQMYLELDSDSGKLAGENK